MSGLEAYAISMAGPLHQQLRGRRFYDRVLVQGSSSGQRVPRELWNAHIGPVAGEIWRWLRMRRDRATGLIIVTAEQLLQAGVVTSRTAAYRGLRRLQAVGLITKHRAFVKRGVEWRTGCVHQRFFEWRVYGGRDVDGTIVVPSSCWEKIMDQPLTGRGGRRKGAGPPKGNQNWRGRPETAEARAKARAEREADRERLIIERGGWDANAQRAYDARMEAIRGEDERRAALEVRTLEAEEALRLSAEKTIEAALPNDQSGALNKISSGDSQKKEEPAVEDDRPELFNFPPQTQTQTRQEVEESGLDGGTAPVPRAQRGEKIPGLPQHLPNFDYVLVPPAQLIGKELDEEAAARLLARLFSGLVEKRTGKPCWILKPHLVHRSRFWPLLIAAAALMRKEGIEPARWIAWSFNVWEHIKQKTGLIPPVVWLFSKARLTNEKTVGWFNRESHHLGGQAVMGPMWRDFMRRWQRVRWLVDQRQEYTEAASKRALREVFPETLDQAANMVACELNTAYRDLRARMLRGEWIWS